MLFMVLTVVLQLAAFVVQGIQCWLEARRAPLPSVLRGLSVRSYSARGRSSLDGLSLKEERDAATGS